MVEWLQCEDSAITSFLPITDSTRRKKAVNFGARLVTDGRGNDYLTLKDAEMPASSHENRQINYFADFI